MSGASVLLRVLIVLNLLGLAAFAAALLLSFPFGHLLAARLAHKYGPSLDVAQGVMAIRLVMILGMAGSVAVHPIFASLLRIVASVEAGDPFVDENATLLVRIGWALLVVQLLDLAVGGVTGWLAVLRLDWAGWSPSVGGWIAVVMIFVLARVFRIGAAMREDLAATV